jgi:hypothetical protein
MAEEDVFLDDPEAEEEEDEDLSGPGGRSSRDRSGGPGPQGNFMTEIQQEVRRIVSGWAKDAGYSANYGQSFVNSYWQQFSTHMGRTLGPALMRHGASNTASFQAILNMALDWYGSRLPFARQDAASGTGSGFRGGGGGGGGPRPPTAAEIRAQFDIDQLANRYNDMSRAFLIEDAADSRAKAKAYVEQVVKNPDQKLDYDTWVQSQLKQSKRWGTIFALKPEGVDERNYLQTYIQQAQALLGGTQGPDSADQVAFEGAGLGASSDAFGQRLARTDAVTRSAPYINELEGRVRSVGRLLGGN